MRNILSTTLVLALLAGGTPVFAQTQKPAADKPTTVVVEAQKRPKRDFFARTWIRGESAHFIIYSDASEADARTVVERLEGFHALLRHIAGLDDTPEAAAPKLELYYLANGSDLATADPAEPLYAIGLYKGCEEGVEAYATDMFYRPDSKTPLEKQPENEGLAYVFEAYARHFLTVNDGHRTPVWFIDGFAHYVATARFDNGSAVVGMAPEAYVDYLRAINGAIDYNLDYKDVLADVDAKAGTAPDDTAAIRNEFGARAWILTHWIESTPQNRAKFSAYLKAVDEGAAPEQAFQTAFGMTHGALDAAMWAYLKGHHVMAMKMAFTAPSVADVAFQTLPPSADNLLLWQSALKTCATPAYGAKLLTQIRDEVQKYPDSGLADTVLARAEILWGDPRRALPTLDKAVSQTPGDFDSQYLLGRAELAIAQTSTGDERAQAFTAAKQAFVKAASLEPTAADNMYAYYRAEILSYDQPNEAALSAIDLAWQLAPEVDTYALAAGLAYAHEGKTDDALRVLHTVADDPHGRSLAGVAKTWIARIKVGASDSDIVAALKTGATAPEGGLAHWTLANHAVLAAQAQAATDQDMMESQANEANGNPSPAPE